MAILVCPALHFDPVGMRNTLTVNGVQRPRERKIKAVSFSFTAIDSAALFTLAPAARPSGLGRTRRPPSGAKAGTVEPPSKSP